MKLTYKYGIFILNQQDESQSNFILHPFLFSADSESDDEMEMRFREAAVSFQCFQSPSVTTKTVDVNNQTEQSQGGETESPVQKKKKIKAIRKKESVETDSGEQKGHAEETHSCKTVKKQNQLKTTLAKPASDKSSLQSREACGDLEEGSTQTKAKQKRKRKTQSC